MKEKFTTIMVLNFVPNFIAIISLYFKTKYLPLQVFAQINFATVFLGFFTLFIDLGITAIHYQYTYKPDFKNYVGSYMFIKIVLIIVNFTIPFIFLFFTSYDELLTELIILNILNGITMAFIELLRTNLQIRLKIMKKEIPFFIFRMSSSIFEIIICIQGPVNEFIGLYIFMGNLIINIIQLGVFIFLNVNEELSLKFNKEKIKRYFIDATPLIIQSIISVINTYLGMFILGNQQGIIEMTYYSFINLYIINIFISFTIATNTMFDSLFPKMINNNDISSIKEIQNIFEKYMSLLFIGIIILVQINAEFVFSRIIPNLLPSVKYLRYMIFIHYLDAIMRPYMGNLIQGKKQKLSSIISTINILLGIVLQILFISEEFLNLGAYGLVFISLFFYIENNVVLRYCSKKFFGLNSSVRHIIHFFGLGLCLLVGFSTITWLASIKNEFMIYGLASIISIFFYFLFLFLTKEIQKKDIDFFRSLINLKNYLNNIKEEFKDPSSKSKKEMQKDIH